MTSWSSSIKIWILQAYTLFKKMSWCETEMQKYMPLVKQNVEVFIIGGQRIDQKKIRDGGGVVRGLRWKHKR